MKYLPDRIGLYIHIPFCEKKCRYCDFYSTFISDRVYKDYFKALLREISSWGKQTKSAVDTVYLGGGTPSLLSGDIIPLMSAIKENFNVLPDAEITAECNPNLDFGFLSLARKAGVNRLSFGIQSGNDDMLKMLGRTHTVSDAKAAIKAAREAGFDNISCDLMIALPHSNSVTVTEDVNFIFGLNPEHISAYILKIEENTAFYKAKDTLDLPDDDEAANQYLIVCRELEKHGYEHYEISNFALKGRQSRHNLKYWMCEEYLGIGPSSHSFLNGKRFYYKNDIKAFINGESAVFDSLGGDTAERIMLGLRLSSGVSLSEFKEDISDKADKFIKAGLVKISGGRLSLTDNGMLVSNSIIAEFIL